MRTNVYRRTDPDYRKASLTNYLLLQHLKKDRCTIGIHFSRGMFPTYNAATLKKGCERKNENIGIIVIMSNAKQSII